MKIPNTEIENIENILKTNFGLLADEIVEILIDLESTYIKHNKEALMDSKTITAIANEFDKILYKRLQTILESVKTM